MQKKPRPHDTERRRANREQWGRELGGSTASRAPERLVYIVTVGASGGCVLEATLCIPLHIEEQRRSKVRIHASETVDTGPMGLNVTNEHIMAVTDKKARSQLRSLSLRQ